MVYFCSKMKQILFTFCMLLVVIGIVAVINKKLPLNILHPESAPSILNYWQRPDVPPKVALQVGHWKSHEVPEELERLRNNTGATGGGKTEWEVNYAIAVETEKILEEQGVIVDILPATVPKNHWADVFVAIHADGSHNTTKSGFKLAAPRRDMNGKAEKLLASIEQSYAETTGLGLDPNITLDMRGYYAFSWWRYDHTVHPMTASVILETGFLSNPSDQILLIENPHIPARGLADGIITYLENENLL